MADLMELRLHFCVLHVGLLSELVLGRGLTMNAVERSKRVLFLTKFFFPQGCERP